MTDPDFEHLRGQGFSVQPARLDDVPAAVRRSTLADASQYGVSSVTVKRYTQEWQAPGFNLERDSRLVLSPQEGIVGCAKVWTLSDPPVHPWIWGASIQIGWAAASAARCSPGR